jgi:hypothetical protein
MKTPRGIRNNNPFNIEWNGTSWQGLDIPAHDGRFCRFIKPDLGIRAGCKILLTYQEKHRLRSIREMISRFAPSHENDTQAYIQPVAKAVGVSSDAPVNLRDAATMLKMARAIITHENGQQPYQDETIRAAMHLAGIDITPNHDIRGDV